MDSGSRYLRWLGYGLCALGGLVLPADDLLPVDLFAPSQSNVYYRVVPSSDPFSSYWVGAILILCGAVSIWWAKRLRNSTGNVD